MKFKKAIILTLILSLLFPLAVQANSAPVIINADPGFAIAPIDATRIAVVSEYLEFKISEEHRNQARVTASYEMKNTSAQDVEQVMIFPFITALHQGFGEGVSILVDGEPIEYSSYRLEDIHYTNHRYGSEGAQLSPTETRDIDRIVTMLNQHDYIPQNYRLDQPVTLYRLHLPVAPDPYQAEVAFKIDPAKHQLMYANFNSVSYSTTNGTGKLATWSSHPAAEMVKEQAYIVILGDDQENGVSIESLTNEDIMVIESTVEQVLIDFLILETMAINQWVNKEELFDYAVKELDKLLRHNHPVFSLTDIYSSYYYNTYLGVFLYSVNFSPNSTSNVTVTYEMQATMDRRNTNEFTNKFLYLLQPAARWLEFGSLEIKIIPSPEQPYIIDSSLPLIKNEGDGTYSNYFSSLPEQEFYFVTYHTDQPDPPLPRVIQQGAYILYFLSPVLMLLLLVAVTLWLIRIRRNNNK